MSQNGWNWSKLENEKFGLVIGFPSRFVFRLDWKSNFEGLVNCRKIFVTVSKILYEPQGAPVPICLAMKLSACCNLFLRSPLTLLPEALVIYTGLMELQLFEFQFYSSFFRPPFLSKNSPFFQFLKVWDDLESFAKGKCKFFSNTLQWFSRISTYVMVSIRSSTFVVLFSQ